jgi:hypothetical protein
MKRMFRLIAIISNVTIMASISRGAGVTVITHGFNLFPGTPPGWLDSMAQAVTNASYEKGVNSSLYRVYIHGNLISGYTATFSRVSDLTANNTVAEAPPKKEHMLLMFMSPAAICAKVI